MFNWVKCHVFGLHGWTEWQYVKDGSCEQARHCIRCGVSQVAALLSHQVGGQHYTKDGSCELTGHCVRCGIILGLGIHHQFSEFRQSASKPWWPCYQERVCFRCGEKEEKVEHEMSWTDRTYSLHGEEYVDQTYWCRHCGLIEDSRKGLPGWYEGRFPPDYR